MQWNDKKIKAPLNPPEGGKLPSFGGVGGGFTAQAVIPAKAGMTTKNSEMTDTHNFINFSNFITLKTKKIWIIQYK